jgi:hypothetical protein
LFTGSRLGLFAMLLGEHTCRRYVGHGRLQLKA